MNDATPQTDIHWRRPRDIAPDAQPPAALRGWLLDPGSLTARLRARLGADLTVSVLAESRGAPAATERERLGEGAAGGCFIRRVALLGAGVPLIYARTVMPARTLTGEGARLERLGDTPLGELVFREFAATRSGFELARMNEGNPLFPELDRPCWARRSLLYLDTGPILVTEAMLPALVD